MLNLYNGIENGIQWKNAYGKMEMAWMIHNSAWDQTPRCV